MTDRVRCADCGKELTSDHATLKDVYVGVAHLEGSAAVSDWAGPYIRAYCKPDCRERVVRGKQ
jgi:hypothetical protein